MAIKKRSALSRKCWVVIEQTQTLTCCSACQQDNLAGFTGRRNISGAMTGGGH